MTLSDPKTIDVGGTQLAYFEQGSGPLVVCVHGYPDTAHTYERLLGALADAGYRAVAPFLRGYHPSAIPADGDYSGITLGQDVLGLIRALGESSAALVGHDWGAMAVYSATMQADPEVIDALVTLAIPHPRSLKPSLGAIWKARHFITYQFKSGAVKRLKAKDFAHLDHIYKRWAPTWSDATEDIARAKACFRNPGVPEAALGFYWSWRAEQGDKEARRTLARRIDVPSLAIGGADDGAVGPKAWARTTGCYNGHYEYEVLDGVGHFPHSEAPDVVVPRVVDFLKTHAPPQ